MNIKARVLSFFKSIPVSFSQNVVWLNPLGNRKDLEYNTRWVFACVRLISEAIASIEWKLYKTRGKKVNEVLDNPLLSLLYNFNDKFTKFDSIKLSIVYLLLQGRSPWILIGENKPKEMWVVPPNNLSVAAKDEHGYPTMYKYTIGAKSMEVPAYNVLDIRNPDPSDPSRGKSVISALRETADTDEYMMKWNKNLMINSARPSGSIEVDKRLKPEEAIALRKMVEETYGGYENAHKVMILQNGTKFVSSTIPPKDLEFISGRKMNLEEILAMFNVPKILLGLEGQYNRAVSETAERVFAKYTLKPIITMMIEQMNQFLVPRFGVDLLLGHESFVKDDRELQVSEWEKGWGKWLSTNDIRKERGDDPMKGGDDILIPLNLIPGASKEKGMAKIEKIHNDITIVTNEAEAKSIIKRVNARNNNINTIVKDIASKFEKKLLDKKKVILTIKSESTDKEDAKMKWWEYTMDLKRIIDDGWSFIIKGILDRQKDIILDNLKNYRKGLDENIKGLVKDVMFNKDSEVKTTIEVIKPQYYRSIMTGAEISAMIADRGVIDLTQVPAVQKWVEKVAKKYSKEITETTYSRASKVLQDGLDAGEGTYGLGNRIEDFFKTTTPSRADLIARTEGARAMTASEAYSFEQYGFDKLEWYMGGSAPCPICQSNSTKEWTIEEAKEGTIPYSHPNCECRFLPK